MTFQALFDDSGAKGQGRWMTMAGVFADTDLLASIADEWDRHLRASDPGRIAYFKMDEACQLRGAFADWNAPNRDLKVLQMAKLIDRPDLLEISARVDLTAYKRVSQRWDFVQPQPGNKVKFHAMDQPYIMLFHYVLVTATTEAVNRGATSPIEIVYDEQSLLRRTLVAGYDELRDLEREFPERQAVMPVQPWFRDDSDFVMLQAADLLAGELRLASEDYPDNPRFIGRLCPNLHVSRYCRTIDESELEALHEHLIGALEREEQATLGLHKRSTCGDEDV
jgi:uncharacterized protein DUF3800